MESETEGGEGPRVKVRGKGLRVRCAARGGVESNGRGCLGRSVAHEMVRES